MTADYSRPDIPAWWSDPAVVGNPLAPNVPRCPVCGTALDKDDRPCPFAPHEETAA